MGAPSKVRKEFAGMRQTTGIQPAGKSTKELVDKGLSKFYAKRPHLKPPGKWNRRSNTSIFENGDEV